MRGCARSSRACARVKARSPSAAAKGSNDQRSRRRRRSVANALAPMLRKKPSEYSTERERRRRPLRSSRLCVDVAHRAMSRPVAPPSAMSPALSTAPDRAVPSYGTATARSTCIGPTDRTRSRSSCERTNNEPAKPSAFTGSIRSMRASEARRASSFGERVGCTAPTEILLLQRRRRKCHTD